MKIHMLMEHQYKGGSFYDVLCTEEIHQKWRGDL